MLWFSGLRGAIAFSLALDARDSSPNGSVILTTTLVIVFISVIGLGALTTTALKVVSFRHRTHYSLLLFSLSLSVFLSSSSSLLFPHSRS
jgi:hypothetical protein